MRGQKDLISMKKGSIGSKMKEKIEAKCLKTLHFGEKLDLL